MYYSTRQFRPTAGLKAIIAGLKKTGLDGIMSNSHTRLAIERLQEILEENADSLDPDQMIDVGCIGHVRHDGSAVYQFNVELPRYEHDKWGAYFCFDAVVSARQDGRGKLVIKVELEAVEYPEAISEDMFDSDLGFEEDE